MLFVVSCSDEDDSYVVVRNNSGVVEQTTIMYFMGTSLKSSFFDLYNIPDTQAAVADGALGENGRLLIFMPSNTDATLYEIYRTTGGYSIETICTYTSNESLTQDRICDVVAKSQTFAPANTYNLIFSGHGTGWVLSSHTSLRSTVVSDINWDNMGSGTIVTRYLGSTSDGFMNIEELSGALRLTSTKFGYLLFDMCLMSNIETLYELRDVCDNVIASPCEVMGFGFPYQTVLPELFDDNGKSVDYSGACYAYYDYYTNHYAYPYGAVAWCVTSELEGLASRMKSINESGKESVNSANLQCYESRSSHVLCDLGDYVSQACEDADLLKDFESQLNLSFPVEGRYHTSRFLTTLNGYAQYVDIASDSNSGVSTSEPSTKYPDEWAETSWAEATATQQ